MCSKKRTIVRDQPTFIESARRAQLLEAAAATVAELGYAQASLARIAERVAISRSVICYHFTTKDELLETLVSETFLAGWEFLKERMDAESDAVGRLRAYIEAELAFMEADRTRVAAVSEIVANHRGPDGRLRFVEEAEDSVVSELMQILIEGQRSGLFRAFDARVMAMCVSQAIDGVLKLWLRDGKVDLRVCSAELVALFARAMT